jgi:chromosome segregation ATPase
VTSDIPSYHELYNDVTMTSGDDNIGEVFEHEDAWENEVRQLMAEAELFQQQSSLSSYDSQHFTQQQLRDLLDKKDDALMLAAKIGHSLLAKLASLSTRNKELEQQIDESADQISQLEFDKSQLNTQLKLTTSYSEDTDDDQDSLDGATCRRRRQSSCCSVLAAVEESEMLRSRVTELETEKQELESRVEQLGMDLDSQTQAEAQRQTQRQAEQTAMQQQVNSLRDKLTAKRRLFEITDEQLNRAKLEIVYLAGQLVQMETEMEKMQAKLEDSLKSNATLQYQFEDLLQQRDEYMSLCKMLRETRSGRRQRRVTVSRQSSIAQELDAEILRNISAPSTESVPAVMLCAGTCSGVSD